MIKRLICVSGIFFSYEIISNHYDKVFCINVIYFWDNLDVPFSKIKTGLKKGGTFCIFMAHRDDLEKLKFTKDGIFNKYSIDQVVDNLKALGFDDVTYNFDKGYLIKCKK